MIYEPAYLVNSKVQITDAEGNIIPGGELWESSGVSTNIVTQELMENHVFELKDTEPGARYRIAVYKNGAAVSFKDLVLIYE